VLALQTVLMVGTTPLSGPPLGAMADAFGARTPVILGGVAALGAAGWGWWRQRRPVASAVRDGTEQVAIDDHDLAPAGGEAAGPT
jgi:hypothetical protein